MPTKRVSKGDAKRLTLHSCDQNQTEWVERWLEQLRCERCLPPQCATAGAYSALYNTLGKEATDELLKRLRDEFAVAFPNAL